MFKLYHCRDARSFRCLWLLEELGLPYELEIMEFPPRLNAPDYVGVNPTGTVPFFVDGATAISESTAILQYLVTKYGPSSLAVTPDEGSYGAWLQWTQFGEAELTYPQSVILKYTLFAAEPQRLPRVRDDYTEILRNRLSAVDAALGDNDFLCAGRFTIADISVGYALTLGHVLGLNQYYGERLTAYLARLQARDAYRAARKRQKAAT